MRSCLKYFYLLAFFGVKCVITKANKQDSTFYELQIITFWEFIHRSIKT